ncbi:hypothetical protein LI328DRAFT_39030 [Trichoderma asperelloides]|nr:hypothetical protein LI328DRAFT_39030 [Trichoderma asperelloides]
MLSVWHELFPACLCAIVSVPGRDTDSAPDIRAAEHKARHPRTAARRNKSPSLSFPSSRPSSRIEQRQNPAKPTETHGYAANPCAKAPPYVSAQRHSLDGSGPVIGCRPSVPTLSAAKFVLLAFFFLKPIRINDIFQQAVHAIATPFFYFIFCFLWATVFSIHACLVGYECLDWFFFFVLN